MGGLTMKYKTEFTIFADNDTAQSIRQCLSGYLTKNFSASWATEIINKGGILKLRITHGKKMLIRDRNYIQAFVDGASIFG